MEIICIQIVIWDGCILLIKTAETDTFFDVRVVARKGGYISSGTEKDCVLATFSLTSASYL